MKVYIMDENGQEEPYVVEPTTTVLELKQLFLEITKKKVTIDSINFTCKGELLSDNKKTLDNYDIGEDDRISFTIKFIGGKI